MFTEHQALTVSWVDSLGPLGLQWSSTVDLFMNREHGGKLRMFALWTQTNHVGGTSGIDWHGTPEGHMTPAVSDCENQTQENSSYKEKQGVEMPQQRATITSYSPGPGETVVWDGAFVFRTSLWCCYTVFHVGDRWHITVTWSHILRKCTWHGPGHVTICTLCWVWEKCGCLWGERIRDRASDTERAHVLALPESKEETKRGIDLVPSLKFRIIFHCKSTWYVPTCALKDLSAHFEWCSIDFVNLDGYIACMKLWRSCLCFSHLRWMRTLPLIW